MIDFWIENKLDRNANKYENHPFQERTFRYASWAKAIEVVGLISFTIFCLALLVVARDYIDVITFVTLAVLFLSILLYRTTAWKKEVVMLRGNQLIYMRGKKRKMLKVNLREIDHIEITFFRFLIHMKNEKKIKFPIGFEKQSYIYGILKYHRP